MTTKNQSPLVTMEDVFQAMKAIENDHAVRVSIALFPVLAPSLGADFGMAVKVYDNAGKLIRELSCSHCYWPTAKYTSWEAAALDCVLSCYKELTETYLPLIALMDGYPS